MRTYLVTVQVEIQDFSAERYEGMPAKDLFLDLCLSEDFAKGVVQYIAFALAINRKLIIQLFPTPTNPAYSPLTPLNEFNFEKKIGRKRRTCTQAF